MKVAVYTFAIMATVACAVAFVLAVCRFFYWLSDGELWGLVLFLALIMLPFAYSMARSIVLGLPHA